MNFSNTLPPSSPDALGDAYSFSNSPFRVYVHIPFCKKRCGYCNFNTFTSFSLAPGFDKNTYPRLLEREIKRAKRWQEEHEIPLKPASSVFFGGGTPTALSPSQLSFILESIRGAWGIEEGAEISTEANPDSVEGKELFDLKRAGFTRVSFGVQSWEPRILKILDRTHSPAAAWRSIRKARKAGLSCSADLIYAAPSEKRKEWIRTVRFTSNLGLDHVSCYALSIYTRTKMGRQLEKGLIVQESDGAQAQDYELADSILSRRGYKWYEVSNWARKGKECLHNIGYWKNDDWIGLGPGAHSHFSNLRFWDFSRPGEWAKAVYEERLPWEGEILGEEEKREEEIFLGLRLKSGLDLKRLEKESGKEAGSAFLSSLRPLARVKGGILFPTRQGRLLNDFLARSLMDRFLD
ncbi:MAG: radical SAM family heme chaperone HemW [Aeriscardovia sp.]|nr:radical SAM family heme chaperone HemW [Aeriscardovia sp.]